MRRKSHRLIAVLTLLALLLPAVPVAAAPTAPDIKGHWAEAAIQQLVDLGAVSGLPDGTFRPDLTVTRAEFVTMVNKSLRITPVTGTGRFKDVKPEDWFAGQVEAAAAYGYVAGNPDGTFSPYRPITREQAAAMLVRAFGYGKIATKAEQDTVLVPFIDAGKVSAWAKADVATAVNLGLMSGYTPTTLAPQPVGLSAAGWQQWETARTTEQREAVLKKLGSNGLITRAQTAAILARALDQKPVIEGKIFDKAGTYGPKEGVETISGDVIIKADGVTLQNLTITGDLIIAETVGDGTVILDNVTVKGDTQVKGGGINSVIFRSCTLHGTVTVEKVDGQIRIVAEGSTSVPKVVLQSGAILICRDDGSFERVELPKDLDKNTEVILTGNFAEVEIAAEKANVKVGAGSTIDNLVLTKNATGTQVELDQEASVTTVTADAEVEITGQGSIGTAEINVDGVVIEQKPDEIDWGKGVESAIIASKTQIPPRKPSGGGGGSSKPSEERVSAISAITGIPKVGVELTAGTLTPSGAKVSYQWMRCSTVDGTYVNIAGATANTYTPVVGDVGKYIKVSATGTGSYTGTVISEATGAVMAAAPDVAINIAAIPGVTAPVRDGAPAKTITETDQYTGTVSWSPEVVGDKFAASTAYTATINLTPKAGYTLSGVAVNFFTVAGATAVTNAADLGVVTAVFPATAAPDQVATPVVTVSKENADNREAGVTFSVVAIDGVTFYYTLDGSNPTSSSTQYTDTVTLTAPDQDSEATITIKAIGIKEGLTDSEVATKTVTYAAAVPENDFTFNEGTKTITGYNGSGGVVVIPSTINDIEVEIIGEKAFYGCTALTSITIPDSVTSIEKSAFKDCISLTSVTFRETSKVTTIGDYAFDGCSSLTSITIPNSVTTIGYGAFYSCISLQSIIVGASNTAYTSADGVLYNKNQTTLITYPAGKTGTSFTIPGSVITIEEAAFKGCESLTGITIPNSVTTIGHSAFYGCTGLTSITFQETSKVTDIGRNAFCRCVSLTSITIPKSVTSIGHSAFSNCTSLISITFHETSSVGSIDDYVFDGCTSLGSITIPNSVTSIGDSAFNYCTGLTSVTFQDTSKVTAIGDYVFHKCESLTGITIPDSVTAIGIGAFWDCTSLTSITIGADVEVGNSLLGSGKESFRYAYIAGGAGTYTGTYDGDWTKVVGPAVTGVSVTGTAKVGETLTAVVTPADATATYQWTICDIEGGTYVNIAGATANTYTPVAGDVGKYIKVSATGTGSYTGTVISEATGAVVAAAPDVAINIAAIAGVTAPVRDAAPVAAITETDQYTGIVTWSPEVVGDKFAASTAYTATITLTAKTGYTLTGVAENFFTVAGATAVSNGANSGVITALFPET